MSTLLKIEQNLKALDQATFQKLCAAYLSYEYEGYEVKEIGGSHGQNTTTTGTPDILIDCKNGKYFFAECTIQKKNITNKFSGDIANCFDTEKTGIAIQDIQLIILCYNTKTLTDKQKQPLVQEVEKQNCGIQFIDIDNLKFNLYKKYPKLAKDFLGIEVDTQQILSITNFIKEQERKATSLHNKFLDRQKELEALKALFQKNNIIILTGSAGVGKTRLAIEVFKQFKEENPDYEVLGIDNKGVPIWNDLQTYFLPKHKYLLIVDDANRITEFQHIVRLSITENFDIKLIVTIRDYALDKIHNILQEYKHNYEEYEIRKLTDDTIKEILASLNITNPICVDNITRIANGNPRLVLMSADFVLKDDDCRKLNNVVDIYNEYFSKILNEINDLNDEAILKTLGIICFFRIVDKENIEFNHHVFSVFDIEENEFWESVYKLNKVEIVDLYEKEIVKILDQTIATYFFYYVFIKEQILDYSILLEEYLDDFSGKVKENFYPILSYFGYKSVMKVLDKAIDKKLDLSKNNEKSLIKFFEVFWFCRKERLLDWLLEKVDHLEPDTTTEYIYVEAENNGIDRDEYLELLKLFANDPDDSFKLSLEVLFEYIKKRPIVLPKVINYFKTNLSFKTSSYNQGYEHQIILFNFLFDKAQDITDSDLAKRIIFSISEHYLNFEFSSIEGVRNSNAISITPVYIVPDNQILEIRSRIFKLLINEFKNYQSTIIEIIRDYISQKLYQVLRNQNIVCVQAVCNSDKEILIKFFNKNFNNKNYLHCKLVHDYINLLKRNGENINAYNDLLANFTNKSYETSLILDWDYFKRRQDNKDLSRDDFEEIKKQELRKAFKEYQFEDYSELLKIFEELSVQKPQINFGWNGKLQSLEVILIDLAYRDIELCLKVLRSLLANENKIGFSSGRLIQEILVLLNDNTEQFYVLISNYKYSHQTLWQLHYFEYLPQKKINQKSAKTLLALYKKLETNLLLRFTFLDRYKNIHKDILVQVIEILLKKCKNHEFKFYFNSHTFFEKYQYEFNNNVEILKELYFYSYSIEEYFDYEGKAFKAIFKLDNNFIYEYLEKSYGKNTWISVSHNHVNFDFIWELDDYETVLGKIFDYLIGDKFISLSEHLINAFFPKNKHSEKIDKFIKQFIQENSSHKDRIRAIFNVITYSYPLKRIGYLSELLKYNQDHKLVERLDLIPSMKSGGGSFVPLFEADKKFWQEVERISSGDIKLLKIKLWAIEQQTICDRQIERELKREFTNEY